MNQQSPRVESLAAYRHQKAERDAATQANHPHRTAESIEAALRTNGYPEEMIDGVLPYCNELRQQGLSDDAIKLELHDYYAEMVDAPYRDTLDTLSDMPAADLTQRLGKQALRAIDGEASHSSTPGDNSDKTPHLSIIDGHKSSS